MIPPGIVNDDLRRAVAIIGRIHGDGDLPSIPMRMTRLPGNANGIRVRRGQFVVEADTGRPVAIFVEVNEAHRGLAAIHEIGHFLDLAGIGRPNRFASAEEPVLHEWRRLVQRSRAIQNLVNLSRNPSELIDHAHVVDLLDPVEAWARCYTQYIVRRSGEPDLQAGLDAFRLERSPAVYYAYYWDEDDFDPLDDALERLFRRLGWRRMRTG